MSRKSCPNLKHAPVTYGQRIRQPTELRARTTYEESESEQEIKSESELEPESESESEAQGTQQSRRRKAQKRGEFLVPCECKTYGNGRNPHFVTQRVCRSHKRQDKEMEFNKEQFIAEGIEASDFRDETNEDIDLTTGMDLSMDMDWTHDNDYEISECSNSDDNTAADDDCLGHHTEFPELYDFSSSDESSGARDSDFDDYDSFDYEECQRSISQFGWVLILGVVVPPSMLRSIQFFMIKIKKNVSAAAHDDYIDLCNAMNTVEIQESRLRGNIWGKSFGSLDS